MGSVLKREGSLDKCWEGHSKRREKGEEQTYVFITKAQIVAKPPTQKRVNPNRSEYRTVS